MQQTRVLNRLTIVAALGYFVDLYDMALYNVLKLSSLGEIGLSGTALLNAEIVLGNWQNFGMLLGGLLWGIIGDKRGRLTVLFGSIVTYSLANIANAFVTHAPDPYTAYAFCRFMAGFGLAGELGAGITLVAETLSKEKRGYGTMLVVAFGLLGAVTAASVGTLTHWKTTYIIGGVLGLLLLFLRIGTFEPDMFAKTKEDGVERGNFFMLLRPPHISKYLLVIMTGLPIWFASGIMVAFSNRFAQASGVHDAVAIATAAVAFNVGLSGGDFLSGWLSQILHTRKRVMMGFQTALLVMILWILLSPPVSSFVYYAYIFVLGIACGYWAIFVTNAAEQFGTNIRSTVANTAPNFVRGSLVPMALLFKYLYPSMGLVPAALLIGGSVGLIAIIATSRIPETYGKELDYVEQ